VGRALWSENAGFHGPPGVNEANHDAPLEIGYGVLPEYRRQGYASEAVEGRHRVGGHARIDHFVASVATDNEPSLAIIRKLVSYEQASTSIPRTVLSTSSSCA
jgi:RimJ/RimL family protein N-acetyltransferase